MSEGIPTRQTLHVDDLEQMAMGFERQGKTEAALELYRQALEREGTTSPRGNRFKTKVTEMERELKLAAVKKPSYWLPIVIALVVAAMAITIVLLLMRQKPASTKDAASQVPATGIPMAPASVRPDDPEPARVEDMVTRYYGFVARGAWSMADNYWTDAWKTESRSSQRLYGKMGPVVPGTDAQARRLTKDRFTVSISLTVGTPPKPKQALLGVARSGTDWQISDEKLYDAAPKADAASGEAAPAPAAPAPVPAAPAAPAAAPAAPGGLPAPPAVPSNGG